MRVRVFIALSVILLLAGPKRSHADVALLLEEPHGEFGAFNPTGHAAVYLSNVCAETPIKLRHCSSGEHGVVISRYHRVAGYDWIAIPLIPYLYAVPRISMVPRWANEERVAELRDEYRRDYLRDLIPDASDGSMPKGDWVQLIGAAYDRKMYVFQISTTYEQDEKVIEELNANRNREDFNLFFRNCSDFSRHVFDIYYPGVMHRSFTADGGITTPKQIAKSLVKYTKKHPELDFSASVIQQVPGTPRSKAVHGVFESIVRSKKYLVPLAVFHPAIAGSLAAAYVAGGRFNPARYAKQPFYIAPEQVASRQSPARGEAVSSAANSHVESSGFAHPMQ
ncbi:MAG TPA: hypothetical protein VKW78_20315 [Terriglobales bacterium]|nr:hypothetical protein [Terriglobales bacterium]